MESLIDIGKISQLGNLMETRRRNDQYEQNSLLQAERNRIDEEQGQQAKDSRDLTAFLKLADDPRVKANPQMSDMALTRAWQLGGGPALPSGALQLGRDQVRKTLDGMASGDAQTAMDGFMEMQVMLGPKEAGEVVTSVQNMGKISEYSANVEAMRTLQGARYEALHDKRSKINAGELPYGQGVRDFATLLQGTDDQKFLNIAKAAGKMTPVNGQHPRTLGAALAKDQPEIARFGGKSYEQAAKTASDMAARISDTVGQAEQTLQLVEQGEPLPPNTTKRDLIERVDVGKTMVDAYSRMSTWAEDPYNLTKLKDAKTAQALIVKKRTELEALKTSTSEEAMAIRRDAQTFRETEAGKKHAYGQAVGNAQSEVLEKFGRTPDAKNLAFVARKYGVQPDEILPGLADPAKKGQLNISLLSPGERKDIAEDRTMVSQIDTLIHDFKPGYVGVLDEKLGKLGQMTGTLSKGREAWLQQSRALLADIRHSKFGASLTENEMKAALSELPNESMGNNQWPAAAKAWRDKWGRLIDERFAVAKESRAMGRQTPSRPAGPSTAEEFLSILGVQ